MSPTYLENKKYFYKWRENNPEKVRVLSMLSKIKYDLWKKTQKIYLRILL